MTTLDKLFGSADFVKIMKLFVLNGEDVFETPEVSKRTRVSVSKLRKHLNDLKAMGMIKKKSFSVTETTKRKLKNGKFKTKVRKAQGYHLNPEFELLAPLRELLVSTKGYRDNEIAGKFKNVGRLKFLAVAGIFLHEPTSRVDIVVVGDHLKRGIIDKALRAMEADIGRELQYAVFDTNEFVYRMEVYDKFVRDILDYPHRKVVNKIGL